MAPLKSTQTDRPAVVRRSRPLAGGLIRVGVATEIPVVLREFGAEPHPILARVGLSENVLQEPENLISFQALGRLVSHCVAVTGCDHFGLLVGGRGVASSLGVVGFLVQQSPDVRSALEDLVRYLHFHDRGAVPRLTETGDHAFLSYGIYDQNVEGADQIADGAMAIAMNLMKGLCGPDWRPDEVLLPRRKPADIGPYRTVFGAPLRFDADEASLVFSVRWLDHHLPRADARLQSFLREHMRETADSLAQNRLDDIRRVVRALLSSSHISAENVARLLNLSRRTLNRRLSIEGTDFRRLSDEVRFATARQLLQDTRMPLTHIAAHLRYSDASAFTRAFKRWAGISPQAWRRQTRMHEVPL